MKQRVHKITFILVAILTLGCAPLPSYASTAVSNKVYWTDGNGQVYYSTNAKTSAVVKIALQLFSHDMERVTGRAAKEKSNATLQIFQLDMLSNKEFSALEKLGLPLHQFITKQDAFYIATRNGKVVVVGSDARGTAYGILEMSRLSGISPWAEWLDAQPARSLTLGINKGFESLQVPSTTYRGLEFNHSRWMNGKQASQMARLMLRLRLNALWQPTSKHEQSYDKAVVDSFEICMGLGKKMLNIEGKKHKKHKHTINHIKTIWEDSQLFLRNTSPALVLYEMNSQPDAYITQVSDPMAAAYPLQVFADKAWNAQSVSTSQLLSHLQGWLSQLFGTNMGKRLQPVMQKYYRLTNIRQPEYMLMPFGDTEFHSGEFGNELERYLYAYDQLKGRVETIEKDIPSTLQEAYFTLIKYPVYTAALVAEKELEAQEARHIARPGLFAHDDEAKAAAALSLHAYQQQKQLLAYYQSMNHGKWKQIIDPNDAILQAPQLPGTLTAKEVSQYRQMAFNRSEDLKPFRAMTNEIIAKDACAWKNTSGTLSPTLIPLLGHSNRAVSLPKDSQLHYEFSILKGGDAKFTLATIPNYTATKGDMRVSVSIDHAEPVIISLRETYNSAAWKNAIWRGQTLKSFYVTLDKGEHTIDLQALDDSVLIDQWAVDFDIDREYYMIPTE